MSRNRIFAELKASGVTVKEGDFFDKASRPLLENEYEAGSGSVASESGVGEARLDELLDALAGGDVVLEESKPKIDIAALELMKEHPLKKIVKLTQEKLQQSVNDTTEMRRHAIRDEINGSYAIAKFHISSESSEVEVELLRQIKTHQLQAEFLYLTSQVNFKTDLGNLVAVKAINDHLGVALYTTEVRGLSITPEHFTDLIPKGLKNALIEKGVAFSGSVLSADSAMLRRP